ncbi:unnamed protein product, partial [marine sediment metagenome]
SETVSYGIVRVDSKSSDTVAGVTVMKEVGGENNGVTVDGSPDTTYVSKTIPVAEWAQGAWGEYLGFPRTNAFYEDRLWWASSTNNPDTLWGSQSSKYENMEYSILGLDSDAIVAPILDSEVSQLQWMRGRRVMAVGAANSEYRFGATDIDKAVTPSDRKATQQTSYGSASVQPVILNNAIFFFQRQGHKLRAMKFDELSENFQADDATLLAN